MKEPKLTEIPKPMEKPKQVEEDTTVKDPKLETKCESESKSEEKKPCPKMSLEWSNVICDKVTDGTTRPYHILVQPNKIRCGGISVIGNHHIFAGLHRLECWKDEDPFCDWPDSHNWGNPVEYNNKEKMLDVSLLKYLRNCEGDTLTFGLGLFHSEAEDICCNKGLKKSLKILDL